MIQELQILAWRWRARMQRLLLGLGLVTAALVFAGCPLTPQGAATAEGVNAIACPLLSLIPVVGGVMASACAGEEAALAAALNAVLAAQAADAGASAKAAASLASGPATAVFAMRAKVRTHIGYVPASIAVAVQAELDK